METVIDIRYNGQGYWSSSEEYEDEKYAGGVWDLAHDFLSDNNIYSEELQEKLYNLIKYNVLMGEDLLKSSF